MRIYTDTLDYAAIRNAVADTRPETDGALVDITEVTLKGRRRRMTYDLQLEGVSARHTRHRNSGKGGADTGTMAATWMDWGWLIAVMFRYEPTAVIGQYDGHEDFLDKTQREIPRKLAGPGSDPSVRNFAMRYAAWWPNTHADPNYAGLRPVNTSPFVLVDRVCPPNNLIVLRAPHLEAWLTA